MSVSKRTIRSILGGSLLLTSVAVISGGHYSWAETAQSSSENSAHSQTQSAPDTHDKPGLHQAPAAAGPAHAPAHWSYGGQTGPNEWSNLAPNFELCGDGRMQSPIDLSVPAADSWNPTQIEFDYEPVPLSVVNNGHTIQVNYPKGSFIRIEGKRYDLLQFHFHTPSEHSLGGHRAPMEVHLVHSNDKGELAVIGILIEAGPANMALHEIWQRIPEANGAPVSYDDVVVDAAAFLPKEHVSFRYMGSLTTPPCTEGVRWFVMKDPVLASGNQIQTFGKIFGSNARPIQPRNHRMILSPSSENSRE